MSDRMSDRKPFCQHKFAKKERKKYRKNINTICRVQQAKKDTGESADDWKI